MAPIVAEQVPVVETTVVEQEPVLAVPTVAEQAPVVAVPTVAEQAPVVAVPTVAEVEQKSGPKHCHNCNRPAFQDCSERHTSDMSYCSERGFHS